MTNRSRPQTRFVWRAASGLAAVAILIASGVTGCTSKSKARAEAQTAYQQGAMQAAMQAEQRRVTVLVRGAVESPVVPWSPGLTLSQAIVQARYKRFTQPTRIVVVRQGIAHPIDMKVFLKRMVDPTLQAGDVVDLQ
ncbi:MAG: hypothetical protein FJ405_08170 [Verrucomicrobia bacterium]|nr:hypothetical protein [Verrucomicrobiota bacterium]